jgi:hypothetical protein
MFQCIALPGAYVNTKKWNVNKMKEPYGVHSRLGVPKKEKKTQGLFKAIFYK